MELKGSNYTLPNYRTASVAGSRWPVAGKDNGGTRKSKDGTGNPEKEKCGTRTPTAMLKALPP